MIENARGHILISNARLGHVVEFVRRALRLVSRNGQNFFFER